MRIYHIRPAENSDLSLVHEMAETIFRQTYRDIISPSQMEYMMDWMYSLPNLRKQVAEGHVYYIAYHEDIPCGYMSVQCEGSDDEGVVVFHLHKIYVMPSEQGKGLGRLFIDKAISHVRSTSSVPSRLELNVNRSNPAVTFYTHVGMRILRQGDFPIGDGFYMNDYIMGLDLNPDPSDI